MKTCRKSRIDELINFDAQFNTPVIGTDEAGRGPIAGPVVASAVYFPVIDDEITEAIKYIDDSKKFSSNTRLRTELSEAIKKTSLYAIAECSEREIEKYNILQASLLAMKRACDDVFAILNCLPQHNGCTEGSQLVTKENALILVDGKFVIPKYIKNQKAVIKGDSYSVSIAASSILAKVHRDEIMENLAKKFPAYGWEKNKGYPTMFHREAVKKYGACERHRKNFLTKILK